MTLLLFIALLTPEDGKMLVLRSGKKIPLQHGFEVEGAYVHFKSAQGQLLQLPVKSVDLKATRSSELARRETPGNPMIFKIEQDRDLVALTNEVFSAGEMGGEKMRSHQDAPSTETNVVLDQLKESEMLSEGAVSRINREARHFQFAEAHKRRAQKRRIAAQRALNDYERAVEEPTYASEAAHVADKRYLDQRVKKERREKMFNGGIDGKSRSATNQRIKDLNKSRDTVRKTKVEK